MHRLLPGKCGSKINVCIVAINSLVAGLCVAWPSAVFPKIFVEGHLMRLTLDEISLSVVFLYIGQLLTLFPYPVVESTIGKAKSLEFGILFALLGWIVVILFTNSIGVYFAMVLFGCWLTVNVLSNGPYLAEISPPKQRGRTLALISIFFMLGAIIEISMSIFLSYRGLALVNFCITFVQFSLLFSLPETPYYYMRKYNVRTARKRFEWFRGKSIANKKEFDEAVIMTEKQMNSTPRFIDFCRDYSTRRALFFSLTMTCFQKLSANVPLQSYCGILLPNSYKTAMFPLTFFTISALFNIISAIFIDRIGRRKLMLISTAGSCVLSLCSAVWFFVHERTDLNTVNYTFVPYMTVALETAFFSLGMQYIPGVINGEIFAAHVKSKALSIIVLVAICHNIINSKMFMVFVQNKLTFINFSVYAGVSAISFFYIMTIFDTKGKTLEEIYDHFERKGRKRSTLIANIPPIFPSIPSYEIESDSRMAKTSKSMTHSTWTFGSIPSNLNNINGRKRSNSLPNTEKIPPISIQVRLLPVHTPVQN